MRTSLKVSIITLFLTVPIAILIWLFPVRTNEILMNSLADRILLIILIVVDAFGGVLVPFLIYKSEEKNKKKNKNIEIRNSAIRQHQKDIVDSVFRRWINIEVNEESQYSGIIRVELLCEGEKEAGGYKGRYTIDYGGQKEKIFLKCHVGELSKFKEAWAHIETGYPEIKKLWEELENAVQKHNDTVDEKKKSIKKRIDEGIGLPDKVIEGNPPYYYSKSVWFFFRDEMRHPDQFYIKTTFNSNVNREIFTVEYRDIGVLSDCESKSKAETIIDFMKSSHNEIHSELNSILSNISHLNALKEKFTNKMSKWIVRSFDLDPSGLIVSLKGRCHLEDEIDAKLAIPTLVGD